MADKKIKHFWCTDCHLYFNSNEYTEHEDDCFAFCPECEKSVVNVPHYYANLKKMSQNATGPKTKEGKERSSKNNYKHGRYAKTVAMLAPALRGKYPECRDCEHFDECKSKKWKHCPVKLDSALKFIHAYTERDQSNLKVIAGMEQARVHQILDMMYADLIKKGVTVMSKGRNTKEWKAHPILKYLPQYIDILGFNSDQQEMNPKSESTPDDIDKGHLADLEHPGDFAAKIIKSVSEIIKDTNGLTTKDNETNTDEVEGPDPEMFPDKNPFPDKK